MLGFIHTNQPGSDTSMTTSRRPLHFRPSVLLISINGYILLTGSDEGTRASIRHSECNKAEIYCPVFPFSGYDDDTPWFDVELNVEYMRDNSDTEAEIPLQQVYTGST